MNPVQPFDRCAPKHFPETVGEGKRTLEVEREGGSVTSGPFCRLQNGLWQIDPAFTLM